MSDQALSVLVEGYDPEKAVEALHENNVDVSEDGNLFYAARDTNGTIMQGELHRDRNSRSLIRHMESYSRILYVDFCFTRGMGRIPKYKAIS